LGSAEGNFQAKKSAHELQSDRLLRFAKFDGILRIAIYLGWAKCRRVAPLIASDKPKRAISGGSHDFYQWEIKDRVAPP
jgi:hypothetical protein